MRGIYLYSKPIDLEMPTGIDKKVLAQIDSLNHAGLNCSMINASGSSSVFFKILSRLPYTNLNPKWEYRDEFDEADYIYIRRPPYCTGYFIHMLKRVKHQNPQVVLLLEIPTYPYDTEFTKTDKRYFLLWRDRYNRRKYKKYIDRIVTFTDDKYIFGIQTLEIQNGIDFNSIPRKKIMNGGEDEIHLIAVAMFAPWHGYDRLLKGLQLYNAVPHTVRVTIDFVGEGKVLKDYKEMARDLGIENDVVFHGMLSGKKLDEIYDASDVAISGLASHRRGPAKGSALKAREYCARGIPFIQAYEDMDFDSSFEYAHTIDASDDPVDIGEILSFYFNLISIHKREEIVSNMREYAEANLSWDKKLTPVISYIRKKHN